MSAAQLFLPYRIAAKPTNVGAPGAQMFVYSAGTTTKRPVYASSSLTTQLSNPVVADGAGRFSDIWLNNSLSYKLVIKDKNGATLDTFDNYVPGQAPDATALQPYSDAAAASATASAGSAAASAASAADSASHATEADQSAADALTYLQSLTALPTDGRTITAASRAALDLIPSTSGPVRLDEVGYEGDWGVVTGDYSALIAADPRGAFMRALPDKASTVAVRARKFTGPVSPIWFGMVEGYTGSAGAKSALNDAAWTVMMTALAAFGKNTSGNFKGLPDVLFPPGCFEFSTTPEVTVGSIRIRGTGMGHYGATIVTGSTRIKCYGCGGFRFQATTTSGIATGDAVSHTGSDGSSLSDMGIEGDGLIGGTAEGELYGVHIRAQTFCNNVAAVNFAGDNWRIEASTSGVKGNASNSHLTNCHGWGGRNGAYIVGNNTGVCKFTNCTFNNNRAWGTDGQGSIGCTYDNVETSNNGTVAANDGITIGASCVSQGGNRYFAINGKDQSATVTITIASPGVVSWTSHGFSNGDLVAFSTTGALPTGLSAGTVYYVVNATTSTFQLSLTSGGTAINTSGSQSGVHTGLAPASTNAPTGTTADNAYWSFYLAGGSTSGIPAWSSLMLVRCGGTNRSSGSGTFTGCYAEVNNQGKFQGLVGDLVQGGKLANWMYTGGTGANAFTAIKPGSNGMAATYVAWQVFSGTVEARVGDQSGNTTNTFLFASEPTIAPSGYRWFFNGTDVFVSYAASVTAAPIQITGPTTTQQFNTGSAVPQVLFARRLAIPSSINGAISTARQICRAAAPTVTYVAASGGTTVDTQARAAQAQLAADLADLRTKLAAANLTS